MFPILLDMEKITAAIDRTVKELSKPDDEMSFSEKQIRQRALAAKMVLEL